MWRGDIGTLALRGGSSTGQFVEFEYNFLKK